jgi:hypothetical protein
MANPSVSQLQAPDFVQVDELDIHQPQSFFQREGKGWLANGLMALVLLAGGVLLGHELAEAQKTSLPLGRSGQFSISFLVVFLVLLPVHEGIHALFFWLQGAKDIRFSFSKKALVVFTVANRHVVNMRQLTVAAMSPFVLLTLLLGLLAWQWPDWHLLALSAAVLHGFLCMGDFILVNYATKYPNRFNFDDFQEGKSYFYEKSSD